MDEMFPRAKTGPYWEIFDIVFWIIYIVVALAFFNEIRQEYHIWIISNLIHGFIGAHLILFPFYGAKVGFEDAISYWFVGLLAMMIMWLISQLIAEILGLGTLPM